MIMRHKLVGLQRRVVISLEEGLPSQHELFLARHRDQKLSNDQSESQLEGERSDSDSDESEKEKGRQNELSPIDQKPRILNIHFTALKKAKSNQVVPSSLERGDRPDSIPKNAVMSSERQKMQSQQTICIDKNLDISDVIQSLLENKKQESLSDKNILSRIKDMMLSPLHRLTAALKSSSITGKTKLLRRNSFDDIAQEKVQDKLEALAQIINSQIKNDKSSRPITKLRAEKQLQKELILASSKTMARERVRDFALSLRKSPLKDEVQALEKRKINKLKINQKGAGGMSRLLAPLFKEDAMDNSLAEPTEEEMEVSAFKLG
jgi:hypothetical protein